MLHCKIILFDFLTNRDGLYYDLIVQCNIIAEIIMTKQPNFEQWNEVAQKLQAPIKEIMELNLRSMQELATLRPDELAAVKKPEDLIEKQINLAVENGHKTLDYLQKSFQVVERVMLSFVKEVKESKH